MEIGPFTCSICCESSQDICIYCTKDACKNHICERCRRCSDCCDCEFRMVEVSRNGHVPQRPAPREEPAEAL